MTRIARRSIDADLQFSPGDIVWVPFPFVEAPRTRERPALVVSVQRPDDNICLLWVLMITSATNGGWDSDVSLENCYKECGLPVPCVLRTAKIATVDGYRAEKRGRLPDALLAQLRDRLARCFNLV